jgi:glycosyltransferase involved in cell wall biosynthesis
MAPAVSVVIPCFNAAAFVAQAVDSVLAQRMNDVQIIVVNDGSSDEQELHRSLATYSEQVELIDQPHGGLSSARNRGIAAAHGSYLAFLDADDLWKPGLLRRQLELLHDSGADLVYCDAELFGEAVGPGKTVMAQYPSIGAVTAASLLLRECLVVMSTVVARTEAVRRVDGFDQALAACEDLDLWMRMVIAGSRISYHREVLVRRRIHASNLSADGCLMANGVLEIIQRYTPAVSLSKQQKRTLDRRSRHLKGSIHEAYAKRALKENNAGGARSELWKAYRFERNLKRLAGVLVITLFPELALRLMHRPD